MMMSLPELIIMSGSIETFINAAFYFSFGVMFMICTYLFINQKPSQKDHVLVDEAPSYKFYMNLFLLNRKVSQTHNIAIISNDKPQCYNSSLYSFEYLCMYLST